MGWLRFLISWNGRIGPKGHALGWLMNLIIGVAIFFGEPYVSSDYKSIFIALGVVFVAFSVISLMVRRYHDLNEKMPVEIVVVEIPIYSTIRDIAEGVRLFTTPGNPNENKYGPPPKF